MFKRPELLTHPNIPKPLHGTNPRSILGDIWWDTVRKEAYAKNDYHCFACGIHKSEDRFHNWLEAHESYKIDYKSGTVELVEIVALCHTCHNFIHSGRLWMMYKKGEIGKEKFSHIMLRGFNILNENNLKPQHVTAFIWLLYQGHEEEEIKTILEGRGIYPITSEIAEWGKWHLIINGKSYYSKFKDIFEWYEYYN